MAVTIIDAFEMIDVQHADRHRVALHREVLEQFIGGRPEAGPVQRTGQVIVVGQVFHLPQQAVAGRHDAGGGQGGESDQHDPYPDGEHPVLGLDIVIDDEVAV